MCQQVEFVPHLVAVGAPPHTMAQVLDLMGVIDEPSVAELSLVHRDVTHLPALAAAEVTRMRISLPSSKRTMTGR